MDSSGDRESARIRAIEEWNRWDAAIHRLCLRAALSAAVCNELEASDADSWSANRLAWNALYHYEAWLEGQGLDSWRDLKPDEAGKDVIRGMAVPRQVSIDGVTTQFGEADAVVQRIAFADKIAHALGFMRSADRDSELRSDVATLAPLVKAWGEMMGPERLRSR